MLKQLKVLYPKRYTFVNDELEKLIGKIKPVDELFSQKDCMLIVYPDHVHAKGVKPLVTLNTFLQEYFSVFTHVHILPFFPYTSDDGFSIVDYKQVNSACGSWHDIKTIAQHFELMFDLVLNHVSAKSEWFKDFLRGKNEYFISYDHEIDTSKVFRPRASPLLTKFGNKYVWTTFSADQVDLNIANPDVLIELVKVLLFYVENGARVIRLDAIAYLWKDPRKKSVSEPQVHTVVSLLREVLERSGEDVILLTETNVDHKQNISYFGNGTNEAHMVYNFTLPPLLLYSFMTQDASKLLKWVSTLKLPNDKTTFLNFTASHDGVGVVPLKKICSDKEVHDLVSYCAKKGGKVGYKAVAGKKEPYELNIVYRDAFENDDAFLASQCIMFSLQGLPAVYFNSIIDRHNWQEGVEQQDKNRAINREKFSAKDLGKKLETSNLYQKYIHMIQVRKKERMFHPHIPQKVIKLHPSIFALQRKDLLVLVNLSSEKITLGTRPLKYLKKSIAFDSLERKWHTSIVLQPYQYLWLK
jgi:glycosidase